MCRNNTIPHHNCNRKSTLTDDSPKSRKAKRAIAPFLELLSSSAEPVAETKVCERFTNDGPGCMYGGTLARMR